MCQIHPKNIFVSQIYKGQKLQTDAFLEKMEVLTLDFNCLPSYMATTILVTDVVYGIQYTVYVGDEFEILVTALARHQ